MYKVGHWRTAERAIHVTPPQTRAPSNLCRQAWVGVDVTTPSLNHHGNGVEETDQTNKRAKDYGWEA